MTDYISKLDRRDVAVTRFSSYLVKQYNYPSLEAVYKMVRLILLDAEEITSLTKLAKINSEVAKAMSVELTTMFNGLTSELEAFSSEEAAYQATTLSKATDIKVKTPAKKTVNSYIAKSLMTLESGQRVDSGTWAQFVKSSASSTINAVNSQIKAGYAANETVSQINKRVKSITGGLLKTQQEALTRTGTQHYASGAYQSMRDDNLDILDREYPVVTFDNRTTDICISISDNYTEKGWPVGESPIGYPPYHWGCRTRVVSLPKGFSMSDMTKPALGAKDTEAAENAFDEREKNMRTASQVRYRGKKDLNVFEVDQVKASTPYSKWLKDQPYYYVKDTLGKARADAFLSGKLDLSKLTDKQLKPLTLEQLGLTTN